MRQLQPRVPRLCSSRKAQLAKPAAPAAAQGRPFHRLNLYLPDFLLPACVAVAIAAFSASAAVCQEQPPTGSDLIHFGDLVDVDVAGSFEFDWRGGLTPEGFLNGLERSPEQIYALCRSESAVAEDIARHYGVFLREPRVTVRILDRSGRAVAVLDGAVKRAYRFRIGRAVRLSELLALSGGITDDAGGEITILRSPASNCEPHPGETSAASTRTIRITDMLEGAEGSNPYIVAGDDIRVVEALPIYLIGGIEVPRPIKARPGISLSRAVAMAGGLTKSAVAANVTIFRREGNARRTLKADLTEISAGRADDLLLEPFDVVDIAEKGRAERKLPPPEDAAAERRPSSYPLRIIE